MIRQVLALGVSAVGIASVLLLGNAIAQESNSYAAIPGVKGGQDAFGAYDPQAGWPKDIAELPGHGDWTFGAGQSVFAESPDRVFYLQRGELPKIDRPGLVTLTVQMSPCLLFSPHRCVTLSS